MGGRLRKTEKFLMLLSTLKNFPNVFSSAREPTASCSRLPRLVSISCLLVCGLASTLFAQQPASNDAPTSISLQRVRLSPMVKKESSVVVLKPVMKDDNPGTTTSLESAQAKLMPPKSTEGSTPLSAPSTPSTTSTSSAPAAAPLNLTGPPEERLAQAKAALQSGKVEEARAALKDLAREFPRSPEAPEALLVAAGAIPDLGAARDELRPIVRNYPLSAPGRQALSRIGDYSFILGDYDECVRAFKAYLTLETETIPLRQAHIQLALAMLRSGQFVGAQTEFQLLRAKYPDLDKSAEILEGEAESLLALGNFKEADGLLTRVESEFPNYASISKVMLSRGICAELDGRSADAKTIYEGLSSSYPQSLEAGLARDRLNELAQPLVSSDSIPPRPSRN